MIGVDKFFVLLVICMLILSPSNDGAVGEVTDCTTYVIPVIDVQPNHHGYERAKKKRDIAMRKCADCCLKAKGVPDEPENNHCRCIRTSDVFPTMEKPWYANRDS